MIKSRLIKYVLVILLLTSSCKEPFDPKLSPVQSNYLVVEGYINTAGITTVTLSRTLPLKDSSVAKPEWNAQVTIAGEDNSVFDVRDMGNGTYLSDYLVLNQNQKYRLHIRTTSGGEYFSDYSVVKQTPEIDSINWKAENNGVRIYVNTHDPQNSTRYYKWDYEETWEIHSAYKSFYKYENGTVIPRNLNEADNLYYCWQLQNNASILLGSSAQLTNDVIALAPIIFVPIESEKISVRYSILITQHSLDRKAYDFYRMMKSNTESLGSLFDPLPSEIAGNITCVSNLQEKVIGYITASTADKKRVFISKDDVHGTYVSDCQTTYVNNTADSLAMYYEIQGLWPYQSDGSPPAPIKGYYSSTPYCIDCTLRGTNVKPSFW